MKSLKLLVVLVLLTSCRTKDLGETAETAETVPGDAIDADGDGFAIDDDCDDDDALINPDAEELCDGVDNNCDGEVDEDSATDATLWYLDADDDGYGVDTDTLLACEKPSGYVDLDGDCDDTDTSFHPEAEEEDCTDPNDYNCDGSVGYADEDEDGYAACEDCNDDEPTTYPGADEYCDGVNNDCDTETDEDDAVDVSTWYADTDSDGYGDPAVTDIDCDQPSNYVADNTDCDDSDITVNPGATESCNGVDDDCDGTADNDADVLGDDTACSGSSCLDILSNRSSAADGDYWIDTATDTIEVTCDMTNDSGGWTLVASVPTPTNSSGFSGWNGISRVGTDFTDTANAFKLSDAEVNALVTTGYRGYGWASQCLSGACTVNISRYWKPTCTYQSNGNSSQCGDAYKDVSFSTAAGCTGNPCGWHYGVTSVNCNACTEFISAHSSEHIGTGVDGGGGPDHAYDGRYPEDPSLEVWVR
jgi:hypothetical protein